MELSQIAKLQDDARAMGRAAQYLGKAANELAPVAVPAARDAIAGLPERLAVIAGRIRSLTPEKLRRKQKVAVICTGVGVAAFTAVAVAHVVHHRRAAAQYREQKRAAEEARQQRADRERVLAEADLTCTGVEFLERGCRDVSADDGAARKAASGISRPGCFAIAAYDEEPPQGSYAGYRDVYVGASKDMSAAAERQLEGEGNLYIHADVVYGQPLRVFFFPCEGYEVYARKEELVRTLGADASYNKNSELADLD